MADRMSKRYTSEVFGKEEAILEGVHLKNPNKYREAIIYEYISSLPDIKIREFVESDESKAMLDRDIISQGTIERLVDSKRDEVIDTTICHMAKENNDPLWDKLVALRVEERRIMNELMDKYMKEAEPVADMARAEFIESFIPRYFQR